EKFVTIYSGMELDKFLKPEVGPADERKQVGIGPGVEAAERRRSLGIEEDAPVVGKVARLFHLKGHKYLLEAGAQVVKVYPKARFLLVGDGILRGNLERQAEDLGIRENVLFAGLVPKEEIPELLAIMDVVVHTSLREGLARVLPQALASGKPVISFDIDGAREVIRDGETGYLVPARDSRKLAEAIIEILGDEDKARRMGEAGRRLVDPNFRAEMMVDKIAGVYEELIKAR
ncbi:glycosyltransferase, partial [bacterium]|nr:glycosyltransferase [bacterium]